MESKQFNKDFEDYANCPICYKIAEDAVESNCCGNIFCTPCSSKVQANVCPLCRSPGFHWHPAVAIRKLIMKLPTNCRYGCKSIGPLEEIKKHELVCSERIVKCTVFNCGQSFKLEEFKLHLLSCHIEVLVNIGEHFDKIFTPSMVKDLREPQKLANKENKDVICVSKTKYNDYLYDEVHLISDDEN